MSAHDRSILARVLVMLVLVGAAVACARPAGRGPDAVRLQLKWLPQAQFAGYYAAQAQGYYGDERLEVTILPGGLDIVPEDVVSEGRADLGITWLSQLLVARERGRPVVNVAQIFTHSGLRQIALAGAGIRSPADLRGRRVAVWAGHEQSLLATLAKHGITRNDITLVPQPVGMEFFVKREVDSASAMTYNELREVQMLLARKRLEEPAAPHEEVVAIDFNTEGTATLEDGLFARADWLRSPENVQIAARFLRASLRGWDFCRDRAADCLDIVLRASGERDRDHQRWMLAEVIKLIYGPPAPRGPVGRMQREAFTRTANILLRHGVLTRPAQDAAYTDAVWQAAQGR